MKVRGRFAPTPSGRMHTGNLTCFLLAWLSAKSKGGEIVLRTEDLDFSRCDRSFAEQTERDLEWLGLTWDVGGSAGGEEYFQSARTELYETALERLEGMGLVYPCFCTRHELHAASAPHASDGLTVYGGKCRDLTPEQVRQKIAGTGRQPALRLRVPDETLSFTDGHLGKFSFDMERDCGDFLLRRSDGVFAYQLAVVADDAAMGVTEVVRGRDLLSSTPWQIYLYKLLGFGIPIFYHAPLLLAPEGRRLSKRDEDDGLGPLREKYSPEEVVGKLAFLCGLNPTGAPRTAESLAADFSWDAVPKGDITVPAGLF